MAAHWPTTSAPTPIREINNFYTATIYEKGAEMIRMLKILIGPDAFGRGMELYFDALRRDGRDHRRFPRLLRRSLGARP